MKFETILTNSRWSILEALADGNHAMSEIAAATGTSLPNVSQQVRLLEAYDLVKALHEEKEGKGKPKTIYRLNKSLAHVAMVRPGLVGMKTVTLDPFHAAMLNVWFLDRVEDHYFLQKFLWQAEELVRESDALAVIDAKSEEIHLLVLAPEERLEKIRKKYSKVVVSSADGEKEKAVISWSHSAEELREGLAKREAYFVNLVKRPHIIYERNGALQEFLKG
jgi:DNA-binding MarR family transcriptional regulator